jgi:hypothetical protein
MTTPKECHLSSDQTERSPAASGLLPLNVTKNDNRVPPIVSEQLRSEPSGMNARCDTSDLSAKAPEYQQRLRRLPAISAPTAKVAKTPKGPGHTKNKSAKALAKKPSAGSAAGRGGNNARPVAKPAKITKMNPTKVRSRKTPARRR